MVTKETKAKSPEATVREDLLAGATKLFTRKGYASTTVREIVSAAGVTKPVLYYYFRNKEGIYLELIRGPFAEFDALLDEVHERHGNATQKIVHLLDQVFSLFLNRIEVGRLMYSIYYGPPQGAPFFDFDTYHLKLQETIRQLVQEGIRRGEFRKGNSEDMMWAILGALNVAIEGQLCHPEMAIDRKGLRRILNLIVNGISRPKGNRIERTARIT